MLSRNPDFAFQDSSDRRITCGFTTHRVRLRRSLKALLFRVRPSTLIREKKVDRNHRLLLSGNAISSNVLLLGRSHAVGPAGYCPLQWNHASPEVLEFTPMAILARASAQNSYRAQYSNLPKIWTSSIPRPPSAGGLQLQLRQTRRTNGVRGIHWNTCTRMPTFGSATLGSRGGHVRPNS
jgi:hypothetical protein